MVTLLSCGCFHFNISETMLMTELRGSSNQTRIAAGRPNTDHANQSPGHSTATIICSEGSFCVGKGPVLVANGFNT